MRTVALVQNQSEMAHYSHADARQLLITLGYQVELFTAANIYQLSNALDRGSFRCVVIGSNALNDKAIRESLFESQCKDALSRFLRSGCGVAVFHQLRLAQMEPREFAFLPEPFNSLIAQVRPAVESAGAGELMISEAAVGSPLLLYPHQIEPQAIASHAKTFTSLPGLYWHYVENAPLSVWNTLLVDRSRQEPRPLVVSAKEDLGARLVVSAVPFDWQQQISVLQNILVFVAEGIHTIALLTDQKTKDIGFDYFRARLVAIGFPHRVYDVSDNLAELVRHLQNNIHTTLIVGPFVGNKAPASLLDVVHERADRGLLKVISVENSEERVSRFAVSGRERFAMRLLYQAEPRIQAELLSGYIDGSFWSTVETLQCLAEVSPRYADYPKLIDRVIAQTNEHDREGSYDEVFGASTALCWFRCNFLGVAAREAAATIQWLRRHLNAYQPREQAQALGVLCALGLATERERAHLKTLVSAAHLQSHSESDLVVFLQAAILVNAHADIPAFVTDLAAKQAGGQWVDVATTAAITSLLIDSLSALAASPSAGVVPRAELERMIFSGIIAIQAALERRHSTQQVVAYPWDNKASTTAKCIRAWLKFDRLIEFPVYELIDAVSSYSRVALEIQAARNSLSYLEGLKQEVESRQKILERAEQKIVSMKRKRQHHRVLTLIGGLLLYALAAFAIETISLDPWELLGHNVFWEVLRRSLESHAEFHIAFITAVLGAIALIPLRFRLLRWFDDTFG